MVWCQSEEFISLRMPYDRDDEWRKGFMEVQPVRVNSVEMGA